MSISKTDNLTLILIDIQKVFDNIEYRGDKETILMLKKIQVNF